MIQFCHDKGIDKVNWAVRFQYRANPCPQSSTSASFYPFPEADKELLEKIREGMVGWPSIVLMRKTVVGESKFRSSSNNCESIERIDPSQLHPYAMCQPMPNGLYTP